jgi:hypothetical protein
MNGCEAPFDRRSVAALEYATYAFLVADAEWQLHHLERTSAYMRKWRSTEISRQEFRSRMSALRSGAVAAGEELQRRWAGLSLSSADAKRLEELSRELQEIKTSGI